MNYSFIKDSLCAYYENLLSYCRTQPIFCKDSN